MGMRLEVLGRAPVGPFFLVANHLSYMDIVALLATTPATFLSKAEVARWPLVGWLARSTGTLFVDRTKKSDLVRVLGAIRGSLSAGQGVVVFPEGTSSEGRDVLPFRPSIFEVPAMLGIPVRCATLTYRTPPGSAPANLAVCWWGDMAFFPHLLALLALPRFEVTVSFGTQELYEADRKRLAERARAAVLSEFRPVVGAC
jgi:1-acyl-sn-glycerol-3-phosphate acyltransferase